MGEITRKNIRKQNFEAESEEEKIEEFCIDVACMYTEGMLSKYRELEASRDGKYINSDLMKMTFPFYAESAENRRKYNMSVTNSAAVLTNEAYTRALENENIKKCIFVTGPYGAGKSYFAQSLYEDPENEELLRNSIVYEGSITPPAFEEKIMLAIKNGVQPYIMALNPTLELSVKNINQRAKQNGRDVEKNEVMEKFVNFYTYMKELLEKIDVPYMIYNKSENISINIKNGTQNVDDLYHGTREELENEYDGIMKINNTEKTTTDNCR